MKEIIQGVYKITNKINFKSYIGISNDIYERWQQHIHNAFNSNNQKDYHKLLSAAIRKYGVDNFTFEILKVENDIDQRKELEKYYIKEYDSFNDGYNMTTGGDGNTRNKLNEVDVINIRKRYNNRERKMIVYEDYKDRIGKTGFSKIWKGETWKYIMPDVYTEENKYWHKMHTGNPGIYNGRAKVTEEEVIKMRKRYKNGESVDSIWEDYKNIYPNKESFRQLIKGERWKIES